MKDLAVKLAAAQAAAEAWHQADIEEMSTNCGSSEWLIRYNQEEAALKTLKTKARAAARAMGYTIPPFKFDNLGSEWYEIVIILSTKFNALKKVLETNDFWVKPLQYTGFDK